MRQKPKASYGVRSANSLSFQTALVSSEIVSSVATSSIGGGATPPPPTYPKA
ncbi:MAG: hypothetical protein LBQ52_10345 [Helicobacteraceae bacterium]|nr:hypothetical protein [Helicobacteraceae bacterium]